MAATVDLWTPPVGMRALDVRSWRAFYSRALDVYSVTPDEYRLLYVAQKGRCWICRTAKGIHPDDPKARGSRRLAIDHDHVTGQVRGLLCSGGDKTCNRVIGWLSAPALYRAAEYVATREGQPARVLREMELARKEAWESEAMKLIQVEVDALAVSYLWPDDPS
jgi:hypothetical protein